MMDAWDRLGSPVVEIDTPALLVDAALLEANIARMSAFGRRTGIGIRPHAKTHKTPMIAHMQLAAGAVGLCCQKVGEAEVLATGGVREILLTNEIVGRAKLERLVGLARHASITVAVDDVSAAEAMAAAGRRAGVTIGVVVDIDVGQGRCGVAPGQPALELGEQIAGLGGLRLRGLQGYHGRIQHSVGYEARSKVAREANARLMETRALFERGGLSLEIVSGAGTGTYETEGAVSGMTDVQPGSYVFMDRQYREIGGRSGPEYDDFQCALTVLATVMSTPAQDRLVVDAGTKALSTDAGPAAVLEPGWAYEPAGDEHGVLRRTGEGRRPRLGDTIRLLPSHCDTTVNLYDRYHVIRDDRLEAVWPIPGRGQIR
jgi:D-serine deaminase-like pyridoxal phosphate-dependent protein